MAKKTLRLVVCVARERGGETSEKGRKAAQEEIRKRKIKENRKSQKGEEYTYCNQKIKTEKNKRRHANAETGKNK